jgi:adenylate cyclase class 2
VSRSPENREIEIKLRAPNPSAAAELLTTHGFTLSKPRVFERNSVFDTPAQDLRASKRLLRVREAGGECKLTFKGEPEPGRYKSREELELDLGDASTFEQILARLGYQRSFAYEKYRTEFQDEKADGVATLDETPIGTFLELEGPAAWIDETAARLGFAESDYITASYGTLYLDWCRERGVVPGNMVWPG